MGQIEGFGLKTGHLGSKQAKTGQNGPFWGQKGVHFGPGFQCKTALKWSQNRSKKGSKKGSKWGHLGSQKGVILDPLSGAFLGEKWSKTGPDLALYTDFRVRFISTAAPKTGQVLDPLLHLFLAKNGPKTGHFGTPEWPIWAILGPLLRPPF